MFRKALIVFSLMLISGVLFYDSAYTHSGRTDANGGHYNRKTGQYHFHNSGRVQARPKTLQPSSNRSQEQGQFLMIQQQAIVDAKLDTEQNVSAPLWFLGGATCGIFTFAYAAIDTPQVPTTRLIGKSPTYIAYYTTEYQSKAKRKRITNSCLGWGTFVVLYFAYLGTTLD